MNKLLLTILVVFLGLTAQAEKNSATSFETLCITARDDSSYDGNIIDKVMYERFGHSFIMAIDSNNKPTLLENAPDWPVKAIGAETISKRLRSFFMSSSLTTNKDNNYLLVCHKLEPAKQKIAAEYFKKESMVAEFINGDFDAKTNNCTHLTTFLYKDITGKKISARNLKWATVPIPKNLMRNIDKKYYDYFSSQEGFSLRATKKGVLLKLKEFGIDPKEIERTLPDLPRPY